MRSERDAAAIACSLEQEDAARRRARWRDLAARVGGEAEPTAGGTRLSFRADDGVADEVEALVALERGCCAWADWAVTSEGAQVVVLVSGHSPEAIAAARGMFGTLAAASPPGAPAGAAVVSTRARVVAGAFGIACLACVVPALLAIGAGGSVAGAFGGVEGVVVGIVLSLAVFVAATLLIRKTRKAAATPEASGCGC